MLELIKNIRTGQDRIVLADLFCWSKDKVRQERSQKHFHLKDRELPTWT